MPAAESVSQIIDWPGIRANAVHVGIREAARQAARNLTPPEQERFVFRVLKRAARQGWEAAKAKAASALTVQPAKPLSSSVLTGTESAANAIADSKQRSLVALSSVVTKVAEGWDKREEGETMPDPTDINQLASARAKLHPTQETGRVNVNIYGDGRSAGDVIEVESEVVTD